MIRDNMIFKKLIGSNRKEIVDNIIGFAIVICIIGLFLFVVSGTIYQFRVESNHIGQSNTKKILQDEFNTSIVFVEDDYNDIFKVYDQHGEIIGYFIIVCDFSDITYIQYWKGDPPLKNLCYPLKLES